MIVLATAMALASVAPTPPPDTPILCTRTEGELPSMAGLDLKSFEAALEYDLGFVAKYETDPQNSAAATLTFQGGRLNAETIIYFLFVVEGGSLTLNKMRIRRSDETAQLEGDAMCLRTLATLTTGQMAIAPERTPQR